MIAHWITGWMRDTIGTYHFAFAIAAMMSLFAIIMIGFIRKPPIDAVSEYLWLF